MSTPARLTVGDIVVPIVEIDGVDYSDGMTPCAVRKVYKNGNLLARSDDGRLTHTGPIEKFRLAKP